MTSRASFSTRKLAKPQQADGGGGDGLAGAKITVAEAKLAPDFRREQRNEKGLTQR